MRMKYLLIFLCLLYSSITIAQKREVLNVPYYIQNDNDPYKQSQCKLDIYIPNNSSKSLPVIVWFHGGV
jgi:carboxylesterase type B